jgi:antitoxin component of MazEF toxin-antitoxin module
MTFCFGLRKLQKIQYSHLIALPPFWIKDMGIEKGDSLKIEMMEDKTLRISPVPATLPDEGTEVPVKA